MENEESVDIFIDKLRQRFAKGFLDLLILQLIETQPTWGYDIIKKTKIKYKFKLRHGTLYPMLNKLRVKGLIKCRKELQKGRVRKIYEITKEGKVILNAYYEFLMEQKSEKINNTSRKRRK